MPIYLLGNVHSQPFVYLKSNYFYKLNKLANGKGANSKLSKM